MKKRSCAVVALLCCVLCAVMFGASKCTFDNDSEAYVFQGKTDAMALDDSMWHIVYSQEQWEQLQQNQLACCRNILWLNVRELASDGNFFEKALLVVVDEQSSGSIIVNWGDVQLSASGVEISLTRFVPSLCTDDMAYRALAVTVSRRQAQNISSVTLVYYDYCERHNDF